MPYLWLFLNTIAVLYTLYYISKPIINARRSIDNFWKGFIMGTVLIPFYSLIVSTATISGLIWVIIPLIIKYVKSYQTGELYSRLKRTSKSGLTVQAFLLIGAALAIIVGVTINMYAPILASAHIAENTLPNPISVYGVNRLIPLYTAYAYASDRIQIPTHTVYKAETYIYYINRTPIYNWIIEPEGFWNEVTKKPIGVIFVEGDKYPVNVKIVNSTLEWGLHNLKFKLFYFDSLERRVKLTALGYDLRFDEAVELYRQGQVWIVIPYNTWERGLLWNLRRPKGIILVNSQGTIRKLSLKQAASSPILEGVPLISEKTAREWAEKYAYRNGFVSVYFKHNKYEIRDVGENPQPYLEPGNNGTLWWVFTVEPAGQTYSTKYVLYINARNTSGKPLIYMWKPDQLLIGVSKVMSYVKQAHPNYDWGQVKAVEPLPTIRNDTVLWKVSVVTEDYRGLISVDIINAKTGQDNSFKVEKAVTANYILERVFKVGQNIEGQNNSIILKINNIQKEINQTIIKLNNLYNQLDQLKKYINSTKK